MQQLQIDVLDRERAVILKVIHLGLDIKPLWYLTRPLIIALTPYMERRGHWEEWHQILERAIDVASQREEVETETTLTSLLARLCQRMSRLQDVVKHYRRVIRLARRSNNLFEEARACSNLGYFYIDGGRWWRSEVLSKQALEIFEKLDSSHGQAHTHNHLGVLYIRKMRWNEADEHLNQACNLWSKIGDEHSMMFGLVNLGLNYVEQEKSEQAIEHLIKAKNLAMKTGDESMIATILNSMASAYRYDDDTINAKSYALKAESIHRQFDNKLGMAQVKNNLGRINLQEGDYTLASLNFIDSLEYYRLLGDKLGEVQVLLDIAELNVVTNNIDTAGESLMYLTTLLGKNPGIKFDKFRVQLKQLAVACHSMNE